MVRSGLYNFISVLFVLLFVFVCVGIERIELLVDHQSFDISKSAQQLLDRYLITTGDPADSTTSDDFFTIIQQQQCN